METVDMNIPEIAEMVRALGEDELAVDIFMRETAWNMVYERIEEATGFSTEEAHDLLDLLTDYVAPPEHPIWQTLHAWLVETNAVLDAEDETRSAANRAALERLLEQDNVD